MGFENEQEHGGTEETKPTTEEREPEGNDQDAGEGNGEGETDVVSLDGVEIGGTPTTPEMEESENDSGLVKTLRKAHREAAKVAREREREMLRLQEEISALKSTAKPEPEEPEPDLEKILEESDFDTKKAKLIFDQRQNKYLEAKSKKEEAARAAKAADEARNAELKRHVEAFEAKKKALKLPDFADAEAEVATKLPLSYSALILQGADNPALVIYALGKAPEKLKTLSEIKDPVKFVFEIAKMESKLKVERRSPSTPPEKTITQNTNRKAHDTRFDVGATFE